jgi:hypothetical protein
VKCLLHSLRWTLQLTIGNHVDFATTINAAILICGNSFTCIDTSGDFQLKYLPKHYYNQRYWDARAFNHELKHHRKQNSDTHGQSTELEDFAASGIRLCVKFRIDQLSWVYGVKVTFREITVYFQYDHWVAKHWFSMCAKFQEKRAIIACRC